MIRIEHLCKAYDGKPVLRDFSLTMESGEHLCLMGPSGCGKTTLLRLLMALERPDGGGIAGLDGLRMSAVFQEDRLLEQLTAAENVRFVCGGLPVETETLLLRLGLEKESLSRSVREFSGGMKRRVAIARALLADFDILFLDEPTLGLDVLARSDLWDTIRALKGRMTIVLTTHYMEEAEELSDRVGVMRDGHLLALGTPAELKAQAGKEKFENAFVAIVRGKAQ